MEIVPYFFSLLKEIREGDGWVVLCCVVLGADAIWSALLSCCGLSPPWCRNRIAVLKTSPPPLLSLLYNENGPNSSNPSVLSPDLNLTRTLLGSAYEETVISILDPPSRVLCS